VGGSVCIMVRMNRTHYEITAYDDSGERLSLSADRNEPDALTADTVWEAIALIASVPAEAWMHWDDGESELIKVDRVVLSHWQYTTKRGRTTAQVNTLETVQR